MWYEGERETLALSKEIDQTPVISLALSFSGILWETLVTLLDKTFCHSFTVIGQKEEN